MTNKIATNISRTMNQFIAMIVMIAMATAQAQAQIHTPENTHHHSIPPAHASSKPITLPSMNQLGKLQFQLPPTQYFKIDDVPIALTSLHDLPMVDISIIFDAGAAYDDTIKKDGYGIANMMTTMLTQGTKDLSEDDFVSKAELLAIHLVASANHDNISIHMRSLSNLDTLNEATALMLSAISAPTFHDDILARNKTQLITAIKQNEQNPNYLATLAYAKALYGTHPYAHPVTGTIQSINNITRQDLLDFATRFLVKNNAHIIITGDVTRLQAEKLASKIIANLKKGNKAPTLSQPKQSKAQHIHIHHPSPQTVVMMGHLTQARRTDKTSVQALSDFNLGNEVLAGGDFTARLMNDIRVKKGYTYGISGDNSANKLAGDYTIHFATQNHMAINAIKDTIAVINDTLTTGISHDELALAQANAKLSFPNHFATNKQIHNIIARLLVNDYDKNHLAEHLLRIDKASLSSVNDNLKNTIHPDDFVIITVSSDQPNLSDIVAKPINKSKAN